MRAAMARQQIVPRPEHARLKGGEVLSTGGRVIDGIAPQSLKAVWPGGVNLGRGLAFPIAEVKLAQARFDVERQTAYLRKRAGERGAALKRRADDVRPRAGFAGDRAPLFPAARAE